MATIKQTHPVISSACWPHFIPSKRKPASSPLRTERASVQKKKKAV
jgi:hypothetical protein